MEQLTSVCLFFVCLSVSFIWYYMAHPYMNRREHVIARAIVALSVIPAFIRIENFPMAVGIFLSVFGFIFVWSFLLYREREKHAIRLLYAGFVMYMDAIGLGFLV